MSEIKNESNNMGWQAIASAAVTGGSGLFGSLIANRGNRKLAEYSYEKNVDMWNRQNEYNSPEQQMLRYKQAGLNPNLIYDGGSSSSGNATQLPKYDAPTLSYDTKLPNILDMMSRYQDIELKQKQGNILDEDVKIRQSEAFYRGLTLSAELKRKFNEGEISDIEYRRKSAELFSTWGDPRGNYMPYEVKNDNVDRKKWLEMSDAYRKNQLNVLSQSQFDVAKKGIMNKIMEMQKNWFRFNQVKGLIPTFVR